MTPNDPRLLRFGLSEIRDAQKPAIEAAIAGEDVLAVMPTGSGKSLCYQLPSLEAHGLTLIISPLLALMRDQIAKLRARDLPVFHVSSAQSDEENLRELQALRTHSQGLFYLSPEQLAKNSIQYWLADIAIARIVIDEAHCFSEWGHDFRPDYRRIPEFLQKRPDIRLSAFTATATQNVVEDLQMHLFAGRNPQVIINAPKRENIRIQFCRKDQPRRQLLDALKDEPTIIYAATRSKTEVLAKALQGEGFQACHYHAGLENDERRIIEADFLQGQTPIIVATNAFGMGVDHDGIRQVIHADMPPSLEAYVQEIGRAGRDGKAARALCLFGDDDYEIRAEQIETSTQDPAHRLHQLALLDQFFALAKDGADWAEIDDYFLTKFVPAQRQNTTERSNLTALKSWRYGRAQAAKIPPFWVLPDDVLNRIASAKPRNLDELAAIQGMGKSRLQNYGEAILEIFGAEISTTKSRIDLALQGNGGLFERLKARAHALRHGEMGGEKPMDCPTPVLTRISKASPRNYRELERIQGMNSERMKRFGDAFLLELQNDNR